MLHSPENSSGYALLGKTFISVVLQKTLERSGIGPIANIRSQTSSSVRLLYRGRSPTKKYGEQLLALDKKQIIWSNDGSGTVRV